MTSKRQMHLGFTIWPSGFHPAGWRLPEARTDGYSNPDLLKQMALAAERGKFDFYFIGDQLIGLPEWQYERPNQVLRPEALSFAGYIAGVTDKIGIVATVNTTYADPFTVARATATLDHMSKGRLGWNVVTGEAEAAAANYGRKEHWNSDRRYEWATEFTDVVKKLWDSWEDGARIADRSTGRFIDETKVHRISHRGEFFNVDGPLNVERPVQGQIPVVNAGRSEGSVEFGARFSDIKFTNSSTFGLAGAKAYYAKLKQRATAYGRDPEQQFIIPGIAIYVAGTAGEAHSLYRRIQDLAIAEFNTAELSGALGADLDGQKAEARVSQVEALTSLPDDKRVIIDEARELFDTVDPMLREVQLSFRRRSYFKEVVGDPRQVADTLEEWFTERAADGFMIFPPYLPGAGTAFVDLVVPELQRRGLFRREYTGSTLREHFGLPRPESRYATRQAAA